jgi:hypothetical protein
MLFNSVEEMKEAGYSGFMTIRDLMVSRCAGIPQQGGVYFVLRVSDDEPRFLAESVGGFFKGQDPTVPVEELKESWVPGVRVIYIGKAGGGSSEATLRSRLHQYMRFGEGEDVGHYGGRYIWQIEGNRDLMICWKPVKEARETERKLIEEFKRSYGRLPFANLTS